MFIRELRKLDSRLKDYIREIVDRSEIKDLMESLINYKVELVDKSYFRLKTSDNVNKYRLVIVNKLEEFLNNKNVLLVNATNENINEYLKNCFLYGILSVRHN